MVWASREKDTTGEINSSYYLAYKISNKKNSYIAYVDASTGRITYDYFAINACQSPVNFNSYYYGNRSVTTNFQSGLYRMQDICPSVCSNLNKNIQVTDESDNLITNTSNSWTTDLQRKAATSQWAASNTYNYFCEKHNWKGFDNNNSLLTIKLDPSSNNGNWEDGGGAMRIGSVGGNNLIPFCTQDIMAHEYTHGFVIANIGNPGVCKSGIGPAPYISCQSISLNEAIADMLGIAVEYYALPNTANFLVGEDAVPSGIRNVSNPKSKGYPNCIKSPDNPAPTNWSNAVGQEMTYNNGAIATFWFYLLCNGGAGNVDDKSTNPAYNVSAIGIDKAAKIVVRALRYYGYSGIGFDQFRRATIESSKDLYGHCSSEVLQTAAAWRAVGLDEFFNYYENSDALDLCGDFGGIPSRHEIYYVQNAATIPATNCSPQSSIVKSGSTLVVTSAQSIVLKPGFKAEAGCRFKATATSCLTQTLRRGDDSHEYAKDAENQTNELENWSIFPNPSQEQALCIRYPDGKEITNISITDIQGKVIEKKCSFEQSYNQLFFSSNTLDKGIYFLHATTKDGQQKILKLIKQ